jgi:hypothetical protein
VRIDVGSFLCKRKDFFLGFTSQSFRLKEDGLKEEPKKIVYLKREVVKDGV